MRAARLYEYNTPLKLEEVDIPQIGPGEALVKIQSCGVCHTDLHLIEGNARNLPHAFGHEGAGDVVEVAEGVTDIKVGDRVAIFLRFVCGDCLYCRTGRDNMCANMKGHFGFNVDGAYADYAKAPVRALFKLPPKVSYEEGGIMADCVATVYRSVVKKGEVSPTDNVMIQGLGGLGMAGLLISKLIGAKVIAVDIIDKKLEFAKKLGADEVINASKENVPDAIKRLTDGMGADRIFDFIGTNKTVLTSLASLGRSGRLVQTGYTRDSFTITVTQLRGSESQILGVTANTRQDLVDTLNLVGSGKLNIKQIITDEFRLSQVNEALDGLRKGLILGRAVVKP
ncbi:MAG: alcohol dehydrogenase catalytic domain-containing protein [Candidatus Bathyarchaeota archaeon]